MRFESKLVFTVGGPVEKIIEAPRPLIPGVIGRADHSSGSSSSTAPIPASSCNSASALAAGRPAIFAMSSAVEPSGNRRPLSQYSPDDLTEEEKVAPIEFGMEVSAPLPDSPTSP